MNGIGRLITVVSLGACLLFGLSATASASPAPVWKLAVSSQPTNLVPGSSEQGNILLIATNVGSEVPSGEVTIVDTLPSGIVPVGADDFNKDQASKGFSCGITGQVVTCHGEGVRPGYSQLIDILVDVTAPEGSNLTNEAEISGGGAVTVRSEDDLPVSSATPPFAFFPGERGFRAPIINDDGTPTTLAGSHPYQSIVDMHFPTIAPGGFFTSAGHLRDVTVDLPRGMIADPAATPVRCTESQLVAEFPGCPDASQVGTVIITTFVSGLQPSAAPLYNMVPPPGAPAAFGFDALGVGIFPHITASIRTESDYGASGVGRDILARGLNPILDVSVELWGDPSAGAHDAARGSCLTNGPLTCPSEPQPEAFLTMPGDCSGGQKQFAARADSWEEPFPEAPWREAAYSAADLEGNGVTLAGCDQLSFEPTISVQPSTHVADSPTGLDVDVHQPQDFDLSHRATAELRDAAVTLPPGMVVNPSQADGLESCSPDQIGLLTPVGETEAHFKAQPSSCPNASRLGTFEATSPLLAQYDETDTHVQRDPETGKVIPEPLHGSVFLARPFENPFHSLLALYLTVEDPKTGIFAKLPARVEPDPVTGQLTTRVEDSPELPIEDVRIHLFGGDRAPLITPIGCGVHTTTTDLVPWSKNATEGAEAHPGDSFETTAAPGGGACPSSEADAPNQLSFDAGTTSPKAGAYSPFVLKLSREDGTQRLAKVDTVLPPGLTGKLAGVAECSDAQIAAAEARSNPQEGRLEREHPSCPDASKVGDVVVGAGAGPNPFYTTGSAYLAGPYKGAPLSLAVITPAIAGPFDLGTVIVRIALQVDPSTAQIHALSDPLPRILDGIPLDVRSVALKMDRPEFTLNPTSCDPMAIAATATSVPGQVAALSQPFQVGECGALGFKPKLKLAFKGGTRRTQHPALKSVLNFPRAGPFAANIGRAVVTLPPSEFIDQAHVGSPCTRPQFAAGSCPKISVLGRAKAWTPLLDEPLEGKVYFRSNGGVRELPDIVVDLRGQIHVELIGAVDTASPKRNARLRTTFFQVPDAPVSRFQLELKGGKEGLLVNSANLCATPQKAVVKLTGQNNAAFDTQPKVANQCGKKKARGKR
jgi:hypothetical protein